MKRETKKLLSVVLAFTMVLSLVLVSPVIGRINVNADTNSTFTLYYYGGSGDFYVDIWNHAGIEFGENVVTSSSWGWNNPQAVMQPVSGNDGWYATEIKIVSASTNDGFDVYQNNSSTKAVTYDNQWNNTTDYAKLVSGECSAYAIKGGTIYTDLTDAGLNLDDNEEGYKVVVTPNTTNVYAGDTVTLTITVTNNGKTVTDLSSNNLSVTTWLDDSTDGNSDAAISDENALTTDVTLPSAGTYYLVTELYDTTRDTLASATTIFSTAVVADINVEKVSGLSDDFIMGMDISSVISEFNSGVTYQDFDGKTIDNVSDFCKFLKSCGVTHVRVRIWNDPYDSNGKGYGGGNNDIETAVEIAEGCKAAGLSMLLDFHCSDFWTDPGKQMAPKAWAGYSVTEKANALKTFLNESLTAIKDTGADIAMVQVGNETTGGFIGETSTANMCTLFNAGSAAIRAFDPDIKVVIHVTNPESSKMTTWAANLKQYNVDYDVLATSYYPSWHGTFANLQNQLQAVQNTYGKEVMVAETSYAFTLEDTDGHTNTIAPGSNTDMMCEEQYPFTVQGQANYLRDLIEAVNEAGGIGVYYWESAWITIGDTTGLSKDDLELQQASNQVRWEKYGSGWASSYAKAYDPTDAGVWYGGSAVDNQAQFAADGSALSSINVWKYVRTGAVSQYTQVEDIESPTETIIANGTYTLPTALEVVYDKETIEEPVVWNQTDISAVDTSKSGTYTIHGTVTFSKTVDSGTYKGQTTAEVTYTLTVRLANLVGTDWSFENGNSNFSGLGSNGAAITTEDPSDGTHALHWYLATAGTAVVTYLGEATNGITLQPGEYTFECKAQGANGDKVTVSVLKHGSSEAIETSDAVSLTGYEAWKTPSASFTLTETTTIDLQMKIDFQAGGWGTLDELYLHPTETPDEDEEEGEEGSEGEGKEEEVKDPEIVEDKTDQTYTVDAGLGFTIYCTGELKDILHVYMDDEEVDPDNYTLKKGSTIITFHSDYMDTLSVGDHTAALEYKTTGRVTADLTIVEAEEDPEEPEEPEEPTESDPSESESTEGTTETTKPGESEGTEETTETTKPGESEGTEETTETTKPGESEGTEGTTETTKPGESEGTEGTTETTKPGESEGTEGTTETTKPGESEGTEGTTETTKPGESESSEGTTETTKPGESEGTEGSTGTEDTEGTEGDKTSIEIVADKTDETYTVESGKGFTIYCTGELKDLLHVYMDNELVDPSNYTLQEGSTIITFHSVYMDTLSVGDHTAALEYKTSGIVTVPLTIMESDPSGETEDTEGSAGTTEATDTEDQTEAAGVTGTEDQTGTAEVDKAAGSNGVNSSASGVITGDNAPIIPIIILVVGVIIIAGVVIVRKKRNT